MRVQLIVNPAAGRRTAAQAAEVAAAELRGANWPVTVEYTEGPGHATELARAAAAAGAEAVFACGGDGTLLEVVNGLLDSGICAGMIPAGTGNDFARTVGLSRDARQAARQLLAGQPRAVDLMSVNDGEVSAINLIGVGFDAAVAARMNAQTRSGGKAAYLSAVALELLHFRPTELRLQVDEEKWEGRALLVAVANAQSYGAGMRIAPNAAIDDGLLDVVLVGMMSRANFVRNLPRVFRGTHLTLPQVRHWPGREVLVETARPQPVMVDGDVRAETPLRVIVLPGRAKLWLP